MNVNWETCRPADSLLVTFFRLSSRVFCVRHWRRRISLSFIFVLIIDVARIALATVYFDFSTWKSQSARRLWWNEFHFGSKHSVHVAGIDATAVHCHSIACKQFLRRMLMTNDMGIFLPRPTFHRTFSLALTVSSEITSISTFHQRTCLNLSSPDVIEANALWADGDKTSIHKLANAFESRLVASRISATTTKLWNEAIYSRLCDLLKTRFHLPFISYGIAFADDVASPNWTHSDHECFIKANYYPFFL